MIGSHLIYQKTRTDAREKIDSEKCPFWLRTYSRIIKNQQSQPVFLALISSLKPWEAEKAKTSNGEDFLDRRWTTLRGNWRNKLALSIRHLITKQAWFEILIILCIIFQGVATGVELDNPEGMAEVSVHVDRVALVVFTVEAALKLMAEGDSPVMFFIDPNDGPFNCYDLAIVVLSFAFLGQEGQGAVQCMRLMRLMRLLTLIRRIRQVRVIVVGLIQGIKSSLYIIMLLAMIVYIFSIVAVGEFGGNDPGHFGDLAVAMISLFQVATLANWSTIAYISVYGCDEYGGGFYDSEDLDSPGLGGEARRLETDWGSFPLWDCVAPEAIGGYTEIFYVLFTTVTARVILSLFIGAIAMAMFSAFSNIEMAEMFDDYAEAMEEAGDRLGLLTPYTALGRKLDAILADGQVPASVNRWSGRYDFRAFVFLCWSVAESPAFAHLVTLTILMIAVVIGIETDRGPNAVTTWLNSVALAVFLVEVVTKIGAQAIVPGTSLAKALKKYFNDNWNKFDFGVVVVGIFEFLPFSDSDGPWVVLRLLRMLRLFRLAKSFPRLRAIIEALGDGMSSALWVCLLIAILNYILACLGMILFRDNDPFHFGSLDSAFFSIWRCETLDSWDVVLGVNMYGCDAYPRAYPILRGPSSGGFQCASPKPWGYVAVAFFVTTVVFGGLILPTVLVGIVAISFERAWNKYSEETIMSAILELLIGLIEDQMPEWWSVDRLRLIKTTFSFMDADGMGALDIQELESTLSYLIKVYVAAVPYDFPLSAREQSVVKGHIKDLFMVVDSSGDASVNVVEFVSFLITTKQVQIKLRQEGVLTAEMLNDAVAPMEKRRLHKIVRLWDAASGQEMRGATEAEDALCFERPHPNLSVLTGADYAELPGGSQGGAAVQGAGNLVEDLSVCIAKLAERMEVDVLDVERWVAAQVTRLERPMFKTSDPRGRLGLSEGGLSPTGHGLDQGHHLGSVQGPSQGSGGKRHLKLTYASDGRTRDKQAALDPDAPDLAAFALKVTAASTSAREASTQTMASVGDMATRTADSEDPLSAETAQEPLIVQGFSEAMRRTGAGRPLAGNSPLQAVLRPLPQLPFKPPPAVASPAPAPQARLPSHGVPRMTAFALGGAGRAEQAMERQTLEGPMSDARQPLLIADRGVPPPQATVPEY